MGDSEGYPILQGRPALTLAAESGPERSPESPGGGLGGDCPRPRLPSGHRFFHDAERETYARLIEWSMNHPKGVESWFVTQTFVNYVPPKLAEGMSNRYLSRLDQALTDMTGGRRLRWIRATEWQVRDVIHYHLLALGCGLSSLSRKSWEQRWKASGGGFCRIYDAVHRSAPYLAKYLNKDRGGELQWGGSWLGLEAPRSVAPSGIDQRA